MKAPADLMYRPRGRFETMRAGAHASSEVGGFGVFRDHSSFLRYPDARRIDLRATLRDPFEGTHVRRFELRTEIKVAMLVDMSSSMNVGPQPKSRTALDLAAALSFSATRIGDRIATFGFADDLVYQSGYLRSAVVALDVADKLRRSAPKGRQGTAGALRACEALGGRRKLVFVISDFRWPTNLVRGVFERLALHDAVPLVLVDAAQQAPPKWGLLDLRDSESGEKRLILMRPALAERWAAQEVERRRFIAACASGRTRRPIFLAAGFDPVDLSSRLMAA